MGMVPGTRIVHLHIPKTAGTAFRSAFQKAADGKLRIFPHYDERQYVGIDPSHFDFFSGHFGYETAVKLGGRNYHRSPKSHRSIHIGVLLLAATI